MTTTEPRTTVDVRRIAGALGAEVHGIDLKAPLTDERRALIESLLLEHLVLFFPGQHLDPAQHRAFASQWGEMENHPFLRKVEGYPEIVELSSEQGFVADDWHTDVTFSDRPPIMSILNHVVTPEVGGDTMWTNQYAVYESFSQPMRDLLDGLTCINTARIYGNPQTRATHPAVRIHPVTGRKCLYVNGQFSERFVELSHEESKNLIDFLRAYATHPRFTVRYKWTQGTLAMWDNRCTQHSVLNDFQGTRVIQRVTILGDLPEGLPPRYEPYPRPTQMSSAGSRELLDR
jgi:taurine dioxygenase